MTDHQHDAAVEAAFRTLYPAYNQKRHGEMRCDMREAIAAFLREWGREQPNAARVPALATADELDPR